jgi:hypothetical protein
MPLRGPRWSSRFTGSGKTTLEDLSPVIGWMLVAKDGKLVGYVAEDRLMRVQ